MDGLKDLVLAKMKIPEYYDIYLKPVRDDLKRQNGLVASDGSVIPDGDMSKQKLVLCPFHNDTDPSLSYSKDKDKFNCFANCGAKGDLIQYHRLTLARYYNIKLSYEDACRDLAKKLGIDIKAETINAKSNYEKGILYQLQRKERYDEIRNRYTIINFRAEIESIRSAFFSNQISLSHMMELTSNSLLKMALVEKEVCD